MCCFMGVRVSVEFVCACVCLYVFVRCCEPMSHGEGVLTEIAALEREAVRRVE